MSGRNLMLLGIVAVVAFIALSPPPTIPPPPSPPHHEEDDDGDPQPPKRRRCGPGPCPRSGGVEAKSHRPVVGGLTSPDGKTKVNLPLADLKLRRNISSGGLGCCGSRALEYSARLAGVSALYDLPEKMRRDGIPGGDNQYSIARKMAKYAPTERYVQDNHSTIEVLAAILATQRMPCIGYDGHDPHYSGHIMHCLNVVACDKAHDWVCILDNNHPKTDDLIWMGCREFTARWTACMDRWVYALLAVRPGAVPQSGDVSLQSGPDSGAWRVFADDPDQYALWSHSVQRGNWLVSSRRYYPRRGPGDWGEPTDPPIPPPLWPDYPAVAAAGGDLNYGCLQTAIDLRSGPIVDGRRVTRAELLRAIGPALVPTGSPGGLLQALRDYIATERGKIIVAIFGAGVLLLIMPQKEVE